MVKHRSRELAECIVIPPSMKLRNFHRCFEPCEWAIRESKRTATLEGRDFLKLRIVGRRRTQIDLLQMVDRSAASCPNLSRNGVNSEVRLARTPHYPQLDPAGPTVSPQHRTHSQVESHPFCDERELKAWAYQRQLRDSIYHPEVEKSLCYEVQSACRD